MGMELHARSRRDLEPDPEFDPICALFYCLSSDAPMQGGDGTQLTGAIMVDKDHESCGQGEVSLHVGTDIIIENTQPLIKTSSSAQQYILFFIEKLNMLRNKLQI